MYENCCDNKIVIQIFYDRS